MVATTPQNLGVGKEQIFEALRNWLVTQTLINVMACMTALMGQMRPAVHSMKRIVPMDISAAAAGE